MLSLVGYILWIISIHQQPTGNQRTTTNAYAAFIWTTHTVVSVVIYYDNLYVTVHCVIKSRYYEYISVYGYLCSLLRIEYIPNSLLSALF